MEPFQNDDLKFDEIGYWSELKLDILNQYASQYAIILNNQQGFSYHYVDAFAGAGKHIAKSTSKLVDGSPWIAVKTTPPFHTIDLIDLDGARVDFLRQEFANDSRVRVHHGDCNDLLASTLGVMTYESYRRCLCLIDPYGLDLNWESIALAGELRTVDLILNFPVMDMNRNVFWKNPEKVTDDSLCRMDRFWGDDSWRRVVWTQVQGTLWDDPEWLEKSGTNQSITNAFRERLKNQGGFEYVPDPIAMYNSRGAAVYYLYFASQKEVAGRIAKHIFNKAKEYQNRGN